MSRCGLRDSDIEKIGLMSELHELVVGSNAVSAEGIKKLAGLHKLQVLRLSDNPIGPDAIYTLGQFKNLSELSIETSSWTEKDRERLRHALPSKCTLHD
jgi:Ran GTPase-activating protein (RanGAP) involved in mRNA processing and transport